MSILDIMESITPSDLMEVTRYGPYKVTADIGCNRVGDKFVIFDMASSDYHTLSVKCSTPERLLEHFKGFIENCLAAK
jgi:hypothetical protein